MRGGLRLAACTCFLLGHEDVHSSHFAVPNVIDECHLLTDEALVAEAAVQKDGESRRHLCLDDLGRGRVGGSSAPREDGQAEERYRVD